MFKKLTKILTLGVMVIMALGLFAGCGGQIPYNAELYYNAQTLMHEKYLETNMTLGAYKQGSQIEDTRELFVNVVGGESVLITEVDAIMPSVEYIGDSAFSGCYGMQSIILSDNLWYIGEAAFSSCYGTKSIAIPASVERIYNFTFGAMYSLETVYIERTSGADMTELYGAKNCGSFFKNAY